MRHKNAPARFITFILLGIFLLGFAAGCRERTGGEVVTIVTSDTFSGLDTLSATNTDAAADRVRTLMFNSLVRKNENFEYVGDLAKEIKIGDDNLTVSFVLPENVKFHNGQVLTSADVKYTLDALFRAKGYKAGSFFDTAPDPSDPEKKRTVSQPHITSIEAPDALTLVIKVARPALVNQLLANLVTIPIIPQGTVEQQKTSPLGSGAFKFVRFDQLNNLVELEAFPDYWQGAPKIRKLHVRTITDANSLQAEFQSGRVDIAPNPTNFSADTYNSLKQNANLQVVQSEGSNVRYIGFNVQNKPISDVNLRQAIAYAVDREKIIKDLLNGQGRVAHSILPESAWAYTPGTAYAYDPAKAKQLLQQSSYRGELIKFQVAAGNTAISQYSQVIQNSLKEIGINCEIVTLENNTLLQQLAKGQFEMTTSQWVGGNQDPIFLRDLFASGETPEKKVNGRNRSRYSNPEFDRIVEEAVNTVDQARAKELYARAQEIVSRDLPLFPLWYPSNMVVASRRMGNIKINPSGDWSFVKDLTVAE